MSVSDKVEHMVFTIVDPAKHSGRPNRAYRATCSDCGFQDTSISANGGRLPVEVVARKLSDRGWQCSVRNRIGDSCPNCNPHRRRKEPAAMPSITLVPPPTPYLDGGHTPYVIEGETVAPEPYKAPLPKVTLAELRAEVAARAEAKAEVAPMTRDDRRIIFAKLNEVYRNEREGYAPGWTDAKVAEDLGINVAWVAEVRDEHFGVAEPLGDVKTAIEEAVAHAAEAKAALANAQDLMEQATKLATTARDIVKGTKSLLERVQLLRDDMERLAQTMGIAEKNIRKAADAAGLKA
jgi:hypothetical protein